MSWRLHGQTGYPYNDEITTVQTVTGFNTPFPHFAWCFDSDTKEIYKPCYSTATHTKFLLPYPVYAWCFVTGKGDSYPFKWVWSADEPEPEPEPEGDPTASIHGSVSNYGSTWGTDGASTYLNTDTTDMSFSDDPYMAQVAANCVNGYVLSASEFTDLKNAYTLFPTQHPAQLTVVSQIYGGNLFSSVLSCKAYATEIPTTASTSDGISTMGVTLVSGAFSILTSFYKLFDFGQVTLGIKWGFSLSHNTYKIYLPYCGLYSIGLTGNDTLHLYAIGDFAQGIITYYLKKNGQIFFTASGHFGVNIPLNVQQGQELYNSMVNTVSLATKAVGALAGGAGGDLAALGKGGAVTSTLGSGLSAIGSATSGQSTAITTAAPVTGAIAGLGAYPYARIIVENTKILNNANSFQTVNGYNKQRAYMTVKSLSGVIKCANYKCSNIGATQTEKTEIEKLMNGGVIV